MSNEQKPTIPNLFEIIDRLLTGKCTNQQARYWTLEHHKQATAQIAAEEDPRSVRASKIADQIWAERMAQDEQWGGEQHDDEHNMDDWLRFIRYQEAMAVQASIRADQHEFRDRMIKVAALALAALESIDRQAALGKLN